MELIGISFSEGLVIALVTLIVLGPKQIQQIISGVKRIFVIARAISAKARARMSQEIDTEPIIQLRQQLEQTEYHDFVVAGEKPAREIGYVLDEIDMRKQIHQMVVSEMEQWAQLLTSANTGCNSNSCSGQSDIIQTTHKQKENI